MDWLKGMAGRLIEREDLSTERHFACGVERLQSIAWSELTSIVLDSDPVSLSDRILVLTRMFLVPWCRPFECAGVEISPMTSLYQRNLPRFGVR